MTDISQHQAKPLAAEPKEKPDYLQPPLAYLVRIPVPDAEADAGLNDAARDRAEDAARWLSFQPVEMVVCGPEQAAGETADLILHGGYTRDKIFELQLADPATLLAYIKDRGPHALVLRQQEIGAALALMPAAAYVPANVCSGQPGNHSGELVAPGGIISVHETAKGMVVRARMRILDFSFTDFVEAVAAAA